MTASLASFPISTMLMQDAEKDAIFVCGRVKKFDKSLQGKKKSVPLQSQFERNSLETQE
jgi:hypothetical protein